VRLLVVGYGNELRRDDGIGPRVAREVQRWGRPGLVGLEAHGLTPEVAEPLSRAEAVVFVDARRGEEGGVRLVEVTPRQPSCLGHTSDPGWLLALAESLWGHRPRAWLLTVPASDFGVGEGLSPPAMRGVAAALEQIRELAGRA
jgi:hydrogenase maturation protease